MDHVLVERMVIYRYRRPNGRWQYVESRVTLTPDVSEDHDLPKRLKLHLDESAEVLFVGPPREIYEGVRWGHAFYVNKGQVSHLIGPR